MFTSHFGQGMAAGLFALALLASSHSAAKADWTISGSCVGGWTTQSCFVSKRNNPRDPHLRPVRTYETHAEMQAAVARDHKWQAFCKPVVFTDRYGVHRYQYAHAGCEYGRSE